MYPSVKVRKWKSFPARSAGSPLGSSVRGYTRPHQVRLSTSGRGSRQITCMDFSVSSVTADLNTGLDSWSGIAKTMSRSEVPRVVSLIRSPVAPPGPGGTARISLRVPTRHIVICSVFISCRSGNQQTSGSSREPDTNAGCRSGPDKHIRSIRQRHYCITSRQSIIQSFGWRGT